MQTTTPIGDLQTSGVEAPARYVQMLIVWWIIRSASTGVELVGGDKAGEKNIQN